MYGGERKIHVVPDQVHLQVTRAFTPYTRGTCIFFPYFSNIYIRVGAQEALQLSKSGKCIVSKIDGVSSTDIWQERYSLTPREFSLLKPYTKTSTLQD